MASHLRKSESPEPASDDQELNVSDFKPTQGSTVQPGELSHLPSTQLCSPPNGNGSCAKQELQSLRNRFHSWLQPEKHSKEEMISQLVMEQFVLTGRCKDKSALRAKWESSGRNMERFMEDLTDECLKPPAWVHVFMQGEEALFPEHMSLKEVIKHLKEQRSAQIPAEDHARTPLQTPQNTPLEAGHEDDEDGNNNPWKNTEVNDSITGQGNQTESLCIIQENSSEPEEGEVSDETPQDATTARQETCRSQEGSIKGPSSEDAPTEVPPEFPSKPEQSASEPDPWFQNHEGTSSCKGRKERSHRVKKSYKCEQCHQVFRHRCYLLSHQRRHRNERTVFCGECHKGFYQQSELRVHQVVHSGEKPFPCNTCGKSFSNKTNLLAHQRIHTGEKPYTCSVCHARFRQSSTYHRHMRNYHKGTEL